MQIYTHKIARVDMFCHVQLLHSPHMHILDQISSLSEKSSMICYCCGLQIMYQWLSTAGSACPTPGRECSLLLY